MRIEHCTRCPRLRTHCTNLSFKKRRAFLHETYWGKPVAGFGDHKAKLMIVGLAPSAHGANRTGRVFTGDRSGQWLYGMLYKMGFSNQPCSLKKDDSLELQNVYISCIVKCAPPKNNPTLEELLNCRSHLLSEIQSLTQVRVFLALGNISFKGLWPLLMPKDSPPRFKHGLEIPLPHNRHLILSYHPSQQNTFTGRLTESMWKKVFQKVKAHAV
jgi:uracil-DNA glycosylase